MDADARWQEYKDLIYKFGVEMGELIKIDPSLADWKTKIELIKLGAPMSDIGTLADDLVTNCNHTRMREWMHWATNNSWPLMVYTAWWQVTQIAPSAELSDADRGE